MGTEGDNSPRGEGEQAVSRGAFMERLSSVPPKASGTTGTAAQRELLRSSAKAAVENMDGHFLGFNNWRSVDGGCDPCSDKDCKYPKMLEVGDCYEEPQDYLFYLYMVEHEKKGKDQNHRVIYDNFVTCVDELLDFTLLRDVAGVQQKDAGDWLEAKLSHPVNACHDTLQFILASEHHRRLPREFTHNSEWLENREWKSLPTQVIRLAITGMQAEVESGKAGLLVAIDIHSDGFRDGGVIKPILDVPVSTHGMKRRLGDVIVKGYYTNWDKDEPSPEAKIFNLYLTQTSQFVQRDGALHPNAFGQMF